MKKFLLILIVFTMFLGLVGCNRDIPNDNLNIDCSINPSDEACLDPSTWNWEYNKTNFDGKNQEVIITVDSLEEMFEKEQIMLIENEYNIKLIINNYDNSVKYGLDELNYVKQSLENNKSDIMLVDSLWLESLVNDELIKELSDVANNTGLFNSYGYIQDSNYNKISLVNNKVYGYMKGYYYPDNWLFYNQKLIDSFNLPDPVTLWNEGNWTMETFTNLLEESKNKFEQYQKTTGMEISPLSGQYYDMVKGVVCSNGFKFIDNKQLLLNSDKVVQIYQYFQMLEEKCWGAESSMLGSSNMDFRDGFRLFRGGKLSDIEENLWKESTDLKLSVVPYPRNNEDNDLNSYYMPLSTTDVFVINDTNQEISSEVLFNILDDLVRGVKPTTKVEVKNQITEYKEYLQGIFESEEVCKALLSVIEKNNTYVELIDSISLMLGDGKVMSSDSIYIQSQKIIGKVNKPDAFESLSVLQTKYQEILDKIV